MHLLKEILEQLRFFLLNILVLWDLTLRMTYLQQIRGISETHWYGANYNNLARGVRETTEFLELFLRNLLLKEHNDLKNRYAHIRWKTIEQDIISKKQDIANAKQDIGSTKQDDKEHKQDIQEHKQQIVVSDIINKKTRQHIQVLFERFGYERFFGRTEVMTELSITASPASALTKKMLNLGMISPMKGKGKGKYLFVRKQV